MEGSARLICGVAHMWRGCSSLRVTLARPLSIGSVLTSGLGAPALLRATSITVPSLANLQAGTTSRSHYDLRVALGLAAGAGALFSLPDAAECAPKRKAKAGVTAAPAPKKKAGTALTAIEAALRLEEDEYMAEKIIADRLVSGKREYLVKWQGYADEHNTWEPLESLANLTDDQIANLTDDRQPVDRPPRGPAGRRGRAAQPLSSDAVGVQRDPLCHSRRRSVRGC